MRHRILGIILKQGITTLLPSTVAVEEGLPPCPLLCTCTATQAKPIRSSWTSSETSHLRQLLRRLTCMSFPQEIRTRTWQARRIKIRVSKSVIKIGTLSWQIFSSFFQQSIPQRTKVYGCLCKDKNVSTSVSSSVQNLWKEYQIFGTIFPVVFPAFISCITLRAVNKSLNKLK
ncbi:hypothetical protein BT96DRAFT_331175 [Gymnopus androsaceus JB14]|uniref:Uncharacterized protein n=1 Tax=Gymnopus androsaceus JB14 TaxID=1447944 RepID=A0A6A4GZJ7_9AGAR|nr:hypothetical protein BT96DRAFT_331175 [Gymnopus androsaceus JB14]